MDEGRIIVCDETSENAFVCSGDCERERNSFFCE
jgi:hypothetical protein